MKTRVLPYLTILAAIFFSVSAQADLSGGWIGWGSWEFDGSGTRCGDVRFAFEENTTELKRIQGHFECDFVALDLAPLSIQKEGADLLIDGRHVGTSDGSSYTWIEDYSDTVKIEVSLRRDGGHMDYAERWVNVTGRNIYHIRARLFFRERAPLVSPTR